MRAKKGQEHKNVLFPVNPNSRPRTKKNFAKTVYGLVLCMSLIQGQGFTNVYCKHFQITIDLQLLVCHICFS